ncbi:MAG: thiamine-phosphate kinase [Chloroflexota bacterium]
MMGSRLADVGEFGLIERIARILEPLNSTAHLGDRLALTIGDDGALWQGPRQGFQAITTDALIEGVHFDRLTTSWTDLGWKSLAVNLSDVGAMGAQPELAVLSLGLPKHTEIEEVEAFYHGLVECASRWHVAIVGGDIVSSPILSINVTAVGTCRAGQLRRSLGSPGDLLAVTGWLGRSGGGLRLLEHGASAGLVLGNAGELIQAHVRPQPRIDEAACLVEAGVRCAMDVSDGLRGDTAHICEQSACEAEIQTHRIPLHAALLEQFGAADALLLALDGGEDYELLCAGSESAIQHAAALMLERTGTTLTVIGRLTESRGNANRVTLLDAQGSPTDVASASWDHFRRG